MKNILIVSNTSGTMKLLENVLKNERIEKVVTSQSACDALKCISEDEFDLIIIDAPLIDEYGKGFAIEASEKTTSGILLLGDEIDFELHCFGLEDYGIVALSKSTSSQLISQSIKILTAIHNRVLNLKNENIKLNKKIDEVRLISRAKLILVQVLNMTENQAQHYIEKQSMDLRQTLIATAENILRTYEK